MVYDCHHAQCCHTLHKDPNSTLDKLTWMQVKHQLSPLQTNIASHETRILTPSHRRLSCGNQSTLQDLQCYENILRSTSFIKPITLGMVFIGSAMADMAFEDTGYVNHRMFRKHSQEQG